MYLQPTEEADRETPWNGTLIMTRVKQSIEKRREEMLIPGHRIKSMKENDLYEAKFCQNESCFSNLGLILTATHLPVCLVGVC